MAFHQYLSEISKLTNSNPRQCIELLTSPKFTTLIFHEELRLLIAMFQEKINKKSGQRDGKNIIDPQLIVSFYSIIIIKAAKVMIKNSLMSSVAQKGDNDMGIYNHKLAIETLSKVYRSLEQNDELRAVIAGLLLRVKTFNNYKMIVKDVDPRFISTKTMDAHHQPMRTQCPNLFEAQISKFKNTQWSQYLRYKPIQLSECLKLVNSIQELEKNPNQINEICLTNQKLQNQFEYLGRRIRSIGNFQDQTQKINIEQLTFNIEKITEKLNSKIKSYSQQNSKTSAKSNKSSTLFIQTEYNFKQLMHRIYLSCLNSLYELIHTMIIHLKTNLLRKLKWFYTYILDNFINFSIKISCLHQSIAVQYSKMLKNLIKLVSAYFSVFKEGFFPKDKLKQVIFDQQYSIYKLIQAILYNEYDFSQIQSSVYQNYQKSKKTAQSKQKQAIIDIVNINMKTLNINIHFDLILSKLIPSLKNSRKYISNILNTALSLIQKYYKLTGQFGDAARVILMIDNAKNTIFLREVRNSVLIEKIKKTIYAQKEATRQGIEYFCEDYFANYVKINKQKLQSENKLKRQNKHLSFLQLDVISLNPSSGGKQIKRTQSRQAVLQGWQNFESVSDHPDNSMIKNSNVSMIPMLGSKTVEVVNNQMFYSVRESSASLHDKKMDIQEIDEDDVLVPQFQ